MKKPKNSIPDNESLRGKSEKLLENKPMETDSYLSETGTLRLVHELQVHQIELELQNEELRRAKDEAEVATQKYTELYDFAPSGFFTLSKEGMIVELNLRGANMLGKQRSYLINSIFTFFVSDDTKSVFNLFLQKIFSHKTKQSCEVTLTADNKLPVYAFIKGIISKNGEHCIINVIDISRRILAEKALRKSEKLNRNIILQTAMDGFWLTDVQGKILEVNETYCMMSGYSQQELLSMKVSELDACETDEEVASHIKKVIETGNDRFETTHRRKDGSIFYVEISTQYRADAGKFVSFLRDITSRKQAEEELRQSEERYKTLFQNSHIVLLLIDPETGEIKDVNSAATRYYGWTHYEMCSKNISEFNTLSSQELMQEMQSAKDEKRNHFLFKHRLANGLIRDVEVYSAPIRFNNKTFIYSIVHDISERTRIESALRDSELKLRKYLEFAPHGVFVTNEMGEYTDVNLSASKITGYSINELLSMKISDFVPDESMGAAVRHFTKVKTEGFATGEFPFIKKDKSLGYWTVDAVKLSDNLFLGFVVDTTERRRAEEALMESEKRYRSLFEQSNDAIFLVDLESGNYIDCNRLAETLTGYTRHEILSLKTGALLPPQRKKEVASNLKSVVSNNLLRKETEIITRDGKIIPIEFNSSLVEINNRQCIISMLHDISNRKAVEEALKKSEERVRFKLQSILSPEGSIADLELNDIIDVPSIQQLMNNFYQLVQIPMAIIDLQGKVLVGVGWQDICTKFHRVHPVACRNCFESDVHLTKGITDGEFMLYKCKNNMWDMATPLIIGDEHKGNLYLGQFFFENEPVDYELFSKQARKYGFDEQEYLDALRKVPRLGKQKLENAKSFFLNFARTI
ncbi:MAG TPA: PAS domain S-box protein, partial [Draconibacterium sp.]|nr:PAS domain S-box protein [Draconibacterium sp.]